MSTRTRVRYPPIVPGVFDPTRDYAADLIEGEEYTERLCACTCGRRWWAEVGTVTRCPNDTAHRLRHTEPFEVTP